MWGRLPTCGGLSTRLLVARAPRPGGQNTLVEPAVVSVFKRPAMLREFTFFCASPEYLRREVASNVGSFHRSHDSLISRTRSLPVHPDCILSRKVSGRCSDNP